MVHDRGICILEPVYFIDANQNISGNPVDSEVSQTQSFRSSVINAILFNNPDRKRHSFVVQQDFCFLMDSFVRSTMVQAMWEYHNNIVESNR